MHLGSVTNLGLNVSAIGNTMRADVCGVGVYAPLVGMRTAMNCGIPAVQLVLPCGLTVPLGATLGHASGRIGRLFWYVLDDGSLAVSGRDFGREGIATVSMIGVGSNDCMTLYGTSPGSRFFVRVGMSRDLQPTAGTWINDPLTVHVGDFTKPLGAFHAYPTTLPTYACYAREPMRADVCEFNSGEFDAAAGRWCAQPEEPSIWDLYGVSCWDQPPPGGWLACWMFIQPGSGATWQETSGYDKVCSQNDPYPRSPNGSATARRLLLRPTDSVRYHVGHACAPSLGLTSAVGTYPTGGPGRNTINYFEGHQLPTLV